MSVSIGLVGLGSFGSAFADLFRRHPGVRRVALCDREPERVARFAEDPAFRGKFSPKDAYESLDDICKSDLDALVIITQPWLHAPQCLQAMESGKHVYSAVPILSVPDGDEILEWCDRLVEASRRTGRFYMLGETTYFRPEAMFCRRRAAEGAFGSFVYCEGEYFHDVDSACNLREVQRHRLTSKAGQEWTARLKEYDARGVKTGPMHYPTHSTSGPVCVMNAHAVRVTCYGYRNQTEDPYFQGAAFSNETALFKMSNGAVVRICEYREIGLPGSESFRVFGTKGSYTGHTWQTNRGVTPLTEDGMRDPLPPDVEEAFREGQTESAAYGGHGGSHAYLVHEFVDAVMHNRQPATNIWEAARYMAMGVMAHKSAVHDGETLTVPDWGDAPA